MTPKFQATYRVTVYTQKETVIVEYPITCKFTVHRGVLSNATTATIQLYNLALSTRNKIFQDAYTNFLGWESFKYVHLEAGYGDKSNMSMIFKGRILNAYSSKAGGQVDIVTTIQAQALDIFDCQTSHQFAAGTSFLDAHNTIASDMPNVTIGNVGGLEGTFQTPTTFDGNAFEQLNKLTGGHSFVDNGVLNTVMDNEVIDVPVPVITDSSGLLETPARHDANLDIKMLFEPSLIIGQLLEIKSTISPNFNGQFKVIGFTHDCLISPTQAGNRITTVNLWIGPFLPSANIAITNNQNKSGFKKVNGFKITDMATADPEAVIDVYNFLQKNNGQIPNTQITANISWKDMIGNDNSNADRKSECTIGVLSNVYSTASTMQKIINQHFKGKKITVNSGWRSKANNTKCKGNPKSKHLYGLAMDFTIQGVDTRTVYDIMNSVWPGWVGYYQNGTRPFIHVQIDGTKKRANDR